MLVSVFHNHKKNLYPEILQNMTQIQNIGSLKLPLQEGEEVDKMILVDRLVLIIVQMVTVVAVEISMVEISQGTVAAMVNHLTIRSK